jgi:hypothetical protein
MKNLKNNQLLISLWSFISTLLPIFFISLFLQGCENSGKVKGVVVDGINNQPIYNVKMVAVAKVSIVEDKKYEMSTVISDNNGEFLLKGLSSKYEYTVWAEKEGYTYDVTNGVIPPEKGQTYLLEEPLKIIKIPPTSGAFAYSDGNYRELTRINFKEFEQESRYDISKGHRYISRNDIMSNTIEEGNFILIWGSWFTDVEPLFTFDGDVVFYSPYGGKQTKKVNNILINRAYQSNLKTVMTYELSERYSSPSGTTLGGVGLLKGKLETQLFKVSEGLYLYVIDVSVLSNGYYSITENNVSWIFYKS